MTYVSRGLFWGGLYLALVLVPLFVLIVGPAPAGSGRLWDLSAACGFVGAAIMATMFVLTARFKRPSAPFGIDLVYYFHRLIALVALAFICAHPLLLWAADPRLLLFLRPQASPWHLEAGVASFACFLALVVMSLWRKRLHLHYDAWRLWHAVLAVLAMVLALLHIRGVGHYAGTVGNSLLWAGITLSCLLVMIYVRLVKPLQMLRHPYRVVRVAPEAGRAWSLELEPERHAGVTFRPGQFAWLTLRASPFGMREHPFSFSSSAESPQRIRFTIKELGDFTRGIKSIAPGELAYVDAPYGAFSIDRLPAPGYVFVAGGIGIAPIMSMLQTLADRRDRRPLLLIYAYNTLEELTFRGELEALRPRLQLEVVIVLKTPPTGWTGEVGLVDADLFRRHVTGPRREFEFLVCGPVAMLGVAERGLHQAGVPLRRIHSELFDLV